MLSLFIILISLLPSQDFSVMQGHLEFSASNWPLYRLLLVLFLNGRFLGTALQ